MKFPKIVWTLLYNCIGVIVPTAIIIFATRIFKPSEVGTWIVFTTITIFTAKIRDALVQAAMVRQAASMDNYFSAVKAGGILSVLIEIFFSLIALTLAFCNFFPLFSPFFLLYPVYGFGLAMYSWQATAHQVKHDVQKMVVSVVTLCVVSGLGLIWLITQNQTIDKLILVQGIGYAGGALAGTTLLSGRAIYKSTTSRQLYAEFFLFGKFGIARDLFGTISARIGIFLTAGWMSLADTATLGIIQRLNQLIIMPSIAAQMLFFPTACRLAEEKKIAELKDTTEENLAKTLATLLPFAILIAIFSAPILSLFEKLYSGGAPLLTVSILATAVLTPFGQSFGSITYAVKKPKLNATVVTVGAILNVILGVALIYFLGLWGAILAPALTDLFGFFWTRQILYKELGLHVEKSFALIPNIYSNWFNRLKTKLSRPFTVKS
jgi:O-antigen/teichoic acid export membrane protein